MIIPTLLCAREASHHEGLTEISTSFVKDARASVTADVNTLNLKSAGSGDLLSSER
jgi:hypothetical protein